MEFFAGPAKEPAKALPELGGSTEVLGTLTLPRGPATLKAEVVDVPGAELMRLSRVWLKRLDRRP